VCDGNEVLGEQWIAFLVHANGTRKVLRETKAHEHECQAVGVLLRMQHDVREFVWGARIWLFVVAVMKFEESTVVAQTLSIY
jgi:hypothetical protein